MSVCVQQSVRTNWCRLCIRFLCVGENSVALLRIAGPPSHRFSPLAVRATISLPQYRCSGFLVLCYFTVFKTKRSSVFLWLSPFVSFDVQATTQNLLSVNLQPIPCLPHGRSRLLCVVHSLLFCHSMLQIGGFVLYDDVCTGDRQVKHCKSGLLH